MAVNKITEFFAKKSTSITYIHTKYK